MSECTCHKNYTLDTLIPKVGVITDICQETPDADALAACEALGKALAAV